jgi:transcriptional regulator with XRE-family HTH domain
MTTFAERLRQLRKEKGLTLEQLAQALATTKATLSRYENNERKPKAEFVQQLAGYFHVSVDYLLGRTDIRNSDVIEEAIKDDPELERIWNMLSNREDVRLMFKKIADLKPADVKRILKIIEIVEEEDSASQL